ncbi:hypothetical protein QVD17_04845 [Tagetes erecta]|uniref:ACB domain-containing protein n=1 Tax=Tagetes erecta TaxID=13708 RepID=A0AAD8LKB5_TARER|nr:hypothetical protein QVD17_04845 [Tagetes erecta]
MITIIDTLRNNKQNIVETVLKFWNNRICFPPYAKILFHTIISVNHLHIFVINRLIFNHLYPLLLFMELFQEFVFTISFSLIVSLLIVKLIAVSSSCDDGNSSVSIRVEEKIEKEWVVCDNENEGNGLCFEDPVKVSDEVGFGCGDGELGGGFVIGSTESGGGVGACYVFDESPERNELKDEGGVDLGKSDQGNVQEDCVKSIEVEHHSSAIDVGEVKLDEVFDDDWQGIETTELEKCFGSAVAFMDSKSSADRVNLIDNEVKIQLYGLHRVAIEGSCFEPQPMALKLSARANWNSWKRLENLGREDAMEQYIALLSQHVPDWMGRHASDKQ